MNALWQGGQTVLIVFNQSMVELRISPSAAT
jgi:hypothetical protein